MTLHSAPLGFFLLGLNLRYPLRFFQIHSDTTLMLALSKLLARGTLSAPSGHWRTLLYLLVVIRVKRK